MSPIRLLLDEDVRPLLAEVLRERGYDAVSVKTSRLIGKQDRYLLEWAIAHERAMFTHNISDFVKLAKFWSQKGWHHFGIIVSDQIPFRPLLRRTLRLLTRKKKEDLLDTVEWLHNYR